MVRLYPMEQTGARLTRHSHAALRSLALISCSVLLAHCRVASPQAATLLASQPATAMRAGQCSRVLKGALCWTLQ